MTRIRRWAVVSATLALILTGLPVLGVRGSSGQPAQATEPYPTLQPTRPFPTLPSNVPSPMVTLGTPTTATPTATVRATEAPSMTPSALPTPTVTVSATATASASPTITATPSATRYLDLGLVLHLPYAAQFAIRPFGRRAWSW